MRLGRNNVTTPVTTDSLIQQTTAHLSTEVARLNNRRTTALSAFRRAADDLDAVNAGLQETVNTTETLMAFLGSMKIDSEKAIHDNAAVRAKILEIIGE